MASTTCWGMSRPGISLGCHGKTWARCWVDEFLGTQWHIMGYIEHHQHWGNYEMQLYTYMRMLWNHEATYLDLYDDPMKWGIMIHDTIQLGEHGKAMPWSEMCTWESSWGMTYPVGKHQHMAWEPMHIDSAQAISFQLSSMRTLHENTWF